MKYRLAIVWFAALLVAPTVRAANLPTAIYVMRVDGSDVRKVADVEGHTDHRNPRFSPAGKHLVFSAREPASGRTVCYVIGIDGSNLRKIGFGDLPDWSPDGKQIVYDDRTSPGNIIVENLDGQGTTLVTSGLSPRWSPDGRMLAFRRDKNVQVLDLISGEQHALLAPGISQVLSGMDWSPGGDTLAVIIRETKGGVRKLLFLDPTKDNQPSTGRLGLGIGGPIAFSPDGKQVAYDFNYKIRIEDVAGGGRPRLIPGQKGHNLHPDWSPDGEWIAFGSDRHTVP